MCGTNQIVIPQKHPHFDLAIYLTKGKSSIQNNSSGFSTLINFDIVQQHAEA